MSDDKVLDDLLKDKLGDAGIKHKGTDEIVCIVDRSGSMNSIREEAQGGLNGFIEDQKKVGKANLTIVQFDNEINCVCDKVNLTEAEKYVLKPRGMTALLDAIGYVISDKEKYTSKGGKTIVVVLTDGDENCSKEWNKDKIFKLINERKEDGWEFMFLAAGQDAISTAIGYGFDGDSAVSFASSGLGATHAHEAMSVYTANLRDGGKSFARAAKKSYVDAHLDTLSEVGAVDDSKSK